MAVEISDDTFEFMKNMVDYRSLPCVLWSTTDYCFVYGNQHFADLLGYEKHEVYGLKFADAMYPPDAPRSIAEYERNTREGKPMINDFPNRYITKQGNVIWLIWKVAYNGDKIPLGTGEIEVPKWWQVLYFKWKYRKVK